MELSPAAHRSGQLSTHQSLIVSPSSSNHSFNGADATLDPYVPVGCLRITRDASIALDNWIFWDSWDIPHPSGAVDSTNFFKEAVGCYGAEASNAAMEGLMALLEAKWIRTQLKTSDRSDQHASMRVYLLPPDLGWDTIRRDDGTLAVLQAHLQYLVSRLDASWAAWNGSWSSETPIEQQFFR